MANRYQTPVAFTMEKNVVTLSMRATFGATGVPTIDAVHSKGIASINPYTRAFNGNTTGSSATITSVTSFAGLFVGQTISGTAFGTAGLTIASISASAGTLTLSAGTGVAPSNAGAIFSTGGQYIIQFGLNVGNRLDTYNQLMYSAVEFRETSSSASGSASVQAFYPAVSDTFVITNNTGVRTIPATATSGSTDAALIVQMGVLSSSNVFTVADPKGGETMHMLFIFSNSSAL